MQAKQVSTHAFETAENGWTRLSPWAQITDPSARSATLVEGLDSASISPLDFDRDDDVSFDGNRLHESARCGGRGHPATVQ